MNQQINLYRGIVDLQPDLSFRHILWIWGIFLMALLLWQGSLKVLERMDERKLNEMTQQQATLKKEVDDRAVRLKGTESNETLQTSVDLLTQNKVKKTEVVNFLKEKAAGDMHGFSEYLAGLSRRSMDGIWYTGIELQNSGQVVELLGKAKEAALIPLLLQALDKEPMYDKKFFTQLEVTQDQPGDPVVSFDIKTAGVSS